MAVLMPAIRRIPGLKKEPGSRINQARHLMN
jgi:hypothetical protein